MTRPGRSARRGSAEAYFSRGQTYYDRAALEDGKDAKPWFDPAAADFKKAVERDGRHYMALDMLGLVHEQTGELDKAIGDFTQEMTLNPLGRARLADAYCARGPSNQKEKKYDAAIADYEKAIEIGATADGCSCDPYDPLVALYDGVSRRYGSVCHTRYSGLTSATDFDLELYD
jgi:tetratricopeptide (TPR) repeat protein